MLFDDAQRLMNLNNQNALYKYGMTPVFRLSGNALWSRLKQKVTFEVGVFVLSLSVAGKRVFLFRQVRFTLARKRKVCSSNTSCALPNERGTTALQPRHEFRRRD